ncbi:MAG: YgaP family membrane protein [Acidiferrobacterales bacterium]
MQQNVGSADKIVRVIVGLGLLSLMFILEGNIRWIGLIGVVPILTALSGWCPAYSLFGLNSSAKKD